MEKLFLLLLSPPDTDVQLVSWCLASTSDPAKKPDSDQARRGNRGTGTIDDFSRIYTENFSDRDIVAVISGQYLTYANVALTLKNQKQMLQALPFLVEEQVIGNIEDMHIAIPEKLSGDAIRIAIIEKIILEKIKSIFTKYSISVNEMFGLPDLLIVRDNELHVLLSDDFAIVKGVADCFQCDQINLETMLELISFDNISTITISLNDQNKDSLLLARKVKSRFGSELLKIKSSVFTEDTIDYLISNRTADTFNCLNIFQGDFMSVNNRNKRIHQFLPLAWVAILCLFLQISFNAISGFYFKRLSDNTNKDAVALYLQLFPDDKTVVDLAAQLNSRTNSLNFDFKASRFPVVFASAISAMNGIGAPKDIKVKQFRYDEESGELKIGLDTVSIALLDKLKTKLEERSYIVEIISANEEAGIIKATVSIKNV